MGRRRVRAIVTNVVAAAVGIGVSIVPALAGVSAVWSSVIAVSVYAVVLSTLAPRIVAPLWRRLPWRVVVVAHTHWDREWYERFEGFRSRLVPTIAALLDLLEREPRFRSFTLDGQAIMVEDHLAVRPDDRARIESLVRDGRLLVGPHYVLQDVLLVAGESIVRNLQEGLRVSGTLGRAARVSYVADPFGHPAQMPQILRGFGYGAYVFSRGVGDEGERLGDTFHWEAPSGDRVLACHLIGHYSSGLPLVGPDVEETAALRRRVRAVAPSLLDRATAYANGSALVLMAGDDHTPAYPRLPDAVDAMREALPSIEMRIGSLEDYVDAVDAIGGVHAGELVSGRYKKILRGVNSARVWIKQENAACERLLLERCEPLDALTGGGAATELRGLWRTLLEQQPHDSISGCGIDEVHDIDMAPRFRAVREGGEALFERLAERATGTGERRMAWNALPWARDAVIDVGDTPVRVSSPALGAVPLPASASGGARVAGDGVIENETLRVEVAQDGTFVVVERASGSRSGRMNLLVDEGDRGDLYTFSYAGPTTDARGIGGTRKTAARGDRAEVSVALRWMLPRGLRDDRLARSPDMVPCTVRITVALDSGLDAVRVRTTIDNNARDHRLRAHFETGTRTLTHVAGAAFAWLERPNRIGLGRGWVEPPIADHCMHELVAVEGATRGVAIGAEGLRDYAVLGDGATIALTLLRAVGFLSRADLPERPGHAGPEIPTPSAQLPGERTFDYVVVPLDPSRPLHSAGRTIREALSPLALFSGDGTARSFVSLDAAAAVELSSLRAGPDGSVLVRLANRWRDATDATVRFSLPVVSARAVDLREADAGVGNTGLDVLRTAAPADVADGALAVRLQASEIGTWLVTLR